MTTSAGRDPDVLHTKEQAAVLGVSDRLLRKMVERGEIPGMRVGRLWLFSKRAVEEAIRAKIEAPPLAPRPAPDDEVIGSHELATRIGMDVKYVRRAYHRGEIDGWEQAGQAGKPGGKTLRFRWQDFARRLRQFQTEGTADVLPSPSGPGRRPEPELRGRRIAQHLGITADRTADGESGPR